jgi:hypothetical protein
VHKENIKVSEYYLDGVHVPFSGNFHEIAGNAGGLYE